MDYQDASYAGLYLDRLKAIAALDAAPYELTAETSRHLALWMSYEDTIRVADLKTRSTRFDRVRGEVKAQDEQVIAITEFMHPRLREMCEMLPASIGSRILGSPSASRFLGRFFTKGRHVQTTSVKWFLMLRLVAGLRPMRPRSLRYQEEQQRIEHWLELVADAARRDRATALELVRCQRLIKGYGDTFDRGLRNYSAIIDYYRENPVGAERLTELRELALSDETCQALDRALVAA